MYRDSAEDIERRHHKLRLRLDELRPQLAQLREIEGEARSIERLMEVERAAFDRRLRLPILENLHIAKPCSQPWDEMRGDDRVRFCDHCRKNVYDLSSLTREEAEKLVFEREGQICARFYRREDGTILTADCPIGLRRAKRLRTTFAAVLTALLTLVGLRDGKPLSPKTVSTLSPTNVRVGRAQAEKAARAGVLGYIGGSISHREEQSRFTGFEILKRD